MSRRQGQCSGIHTVLAFRVDFTEVNPRIVSWLKQLISYFLNYQFFDDK